MLIKIILSELYDISFCLLKKTKFIILKYKNVLSYFEIPFNTVFVKKHNILIFLNADNHFFCSLQNWFKRFKRPSRKKLIFVGRGLKASFLRKNGIRMLKLKLEYSHYKFLCIPLNIKIKIRKNVLTFESFNSVELGNFLYKIKILKFPNSYKGKGIHYKYENQNLKQIKKSK
jgi:hypothetical protein